MDKFNVNLTSATGCAAGQHGSVCSAALRNCIRNIMLLISSDLCWQSTAQRLAALCCTAQHKFCHLTFAGNTVTCTDAVVLENTGNVEVNVGSIAGTSGTDVVACDATVPTAGSPLLVRVGQVVTCTVSKMTSQADFDASSISLSVTVDEVVAKGRNNSIDNQAITRTLTKALTQERTIRVELLAVTSADVDAKGGCMSASSGGLFFAILLATQSCLASHCVGKSDVVKISANQLFHCCSLSKTYCGQVRMQHGHMSPFVG